MRSSSARAQVYPSMDRGSDSFNPADGDRVEPTMRIAALALFSFACSRPVPAPAAPAGPTVDDLVHSMWADANVTPAPVADEGAFLRRVSLDLSGKLPSRQASATYLADPDPGKKAKLVDRLLGSDDYAEHWADIYLALFGGRTLRPPALRDTVHRW